MNFILHSHIDQASIDSSLGLPEYSYYFVLKEFRHALEKLGTIRMVQDPALEVDAIYKECQEQGEDCVFIAFSPPNKAPVGLACPTLCVFAWEFDSIPDESWDGDPRNDWRYVFEDHGRTICLSEDSARAVRRAMGEDFPVAAIPVPVWDRFSSAANKQIGLPVIEPTELSVAGNIVDSRLYSVTSELIELDEPERCFAIADWNDQDIALDFRVGEGQAGYLVGFYEPESWGTWSKVEEPWILLPCRLEGEFWVSLTTAAFGANARRKLSIKIGDQSRTVVLTEGFTTFQLKFTLGKPASRIRFLGLDLSPSPSATDPRTMGLGLKNLSLSRSEPPASDEETVIVTEAARTGLHDAGNIHFKFTEVLPDNCQLIGFYHGEAWGVWSRTANPWILLSEELGGKIVVEIMARGYGANIGKSIEVIMGTQTQSIVLGDKLDSFSLSFDLDSPAEAIRFKGLDIKPLKDAVDPRTMGIGLASLGITIVEKAGAHVAPPVASTNPSGQLRTTISGVIYTSVFNPGDDRKNWIDMLTAFVYAFRDEEDATLLLKMTHNSIASFLGTFHYYLQRLAPFKCRVLIVHGFLEDQAYEDLIAASSYYVNTSRCEGLCLPLMEFMACGKPGIVPLHTAMRDYVDDECCLLIECAREPGIWPHDPRDVFRALRYRLDWWTLVERYRESYHIAKQDVPRYQKLGQHSIAKIRDFCSQERVENKLAQFLRVESDS